MIYRGSCHCQAVTFTVEAPEALDVLHCNCSMCRKTGLSHLIVPLSRFKLLDGEEALESYRFGTGVANHTFCRICGVRPFYYPRSNPDGVSINVRCIDDPIKSLSYQDFDGVNWEEHASALAHLSQDDA